MGSIQFPEIFLIMVLALLLFGPKKLPEIGRTMGKAIRELKKAAREFTSSVEEITSDEDDLNT
ncbi:MAG: twin-arginine translocase TatA/TatE family subunit [Armatimonadota bacterium]|nr:twin-arginine translocase TatA/TatE family subunit [Armatimonadota bacterium]